MRGRLHHEPSHAAPRLRFVEARVGDERARCPAVWFNQQWVVDRLPPGTRVRLRGAIERGGGFVVRDYEDGAEAAGACRFRRPSTARARRPLRGGCGSIVAKGLVHLPDVADPLPAGLRARLELPLKRDALSVLHRPDTLGRAEARTQAARVRGAAGAPARPRPPPSRPRGAGRRRLVGRRETLAGRLPRRRCRSRSPRHRSGRSPRSTSTWRAPSRWSGSCKATSARGRRSVALYALVRAVERGCQGALMAPTETLAEQHFLTIEGICARLGVPVVLLTSSLGRARACGGTGSARGRRSGRRGRDARAHPGGGRAPRPRGRRRRRAAPVRGRAAGRARARANAAPAAHDRDADSADARADGLRRPVGERDRRGLRRDASRSSPAGSRTSAARRRTRGSPATWPRVGRRTSSALSSRRRRRSRPAPRRTRRSGSPAPSSASSESAACTASFRRQSAAP